jgi:1,4-alpha-glucan branching enzyme
MITKAYSKTGKNCRVTFRVPAKELSAETVSVLGDFNEWNPETHPLQLRKNGTFSTTVSLDGGKDYRFRYLVDGDRWANEEDVENLVPNGLGSADNVLGL